MVTVEADVVAVERRLAAGELMCPDCSEHAVLVGWGHARRRVLRGPDESRVELRPRRTRCSGCERTHVLLPLTVLVRRAALAEVIGRALELKALGWGFRRIAVELRCRAETVGRWLRRFADRSEPVRAVFTRLLRDLEPDPVLPEPAGSAWADAVAAINAAAAAAVRRFAVGKVAPWELAVAVSGGRLLAPGWPSS